MDSLHVLFQRQQERQRLLQEHQQLQQQRKKNKLPPITESPELPPLPPVCPASHPQFVGPLQGDGVHGLQTRESLDRSLIMQQGAVPRLGYVSLFPFLLQVLDVVEHPETLEHALRLMEPASFSLSSSSSKMGVDGSNEPAKESLLWTPFGLRSLASADRFYQRRNAPGDAPYWRGPIWININYLALSSLHHYAALPATPPALRHRCARLYRTLRHHLLRNLLKNYRETGFFWEQYDDVTGQGIRGHPFTGWTATVVNIFTENY
jgi:mannosyl-oligosaccharide glucosidase